MWRRLFDILSSLKLTLLCLVGALLLVLAGTLAQVHYGIQIVQERYFQSLFVWWPADSAGFKIPIFPGGHLLGGLLLANLIAAHIRRFEWTWRKLGIQLTHLGLIIMLIGGLFTDLFSVESFMRLDEGETKNYSEDQNKVELAVTDLTPGGYDQVTTIPQARLQRGGTIAHPSLPYRILIRKFYQNSEIQMLDKAGAAAVPAALQGVGARVAVRELARETRANAKDTVSVVIELLPAPAENGATGASLGTWLVSEALGAPQTFSVAGQTWRLDVRSARHYKPYSLTLQKFTHERYPGTEIPKNFASSVKLTDPDRKSERDVLIYMNHPLRYRGETYYQAGFDKSDKTTILQVVHNPSFVAPYIACIVVGIGLLIQFSYHLTGFLRRHKTKPAL